MNFVLKFVMKDLGLRSCGTALINSMGTRLVKANSHCRKGAGFQSKSWVHTEPVGVKKEITHMLLLSVPGLVSASMYHGMVIFAII